MIQQLQQGPQFGPTMGERLARSLRRTVEFPQVATWSELAYLVDAWFVEDSVSEEMQDLISAGRQGRLGIRPGTAGREWWPWCPEVETLLDRGDPPAVIPGFLDYFLRITHKQVRLRIKHEKDPLTRMGLSQVAAPPDTLNFRILRPGVFIDGLEPGQTMIISGPSGSGKTFMAVYDIILPALQMGYHVISNILFRQPTKNYHYVRTLSEYLLKIIELAIDGKRVLAVRDEGTLGRARSKAQSQRNQDLKMLTMIMRKLGAVEITIYQIAGDVPTELREFCTHEIIKPSARHKDQAFINIPVDGLRGRMISGILGEKEREQYGQPIIIYDTRDIAKLKHDIQVLPLLEYQSAVSYDGEVGIAPSVDEQLHALREYILKMTARGLPQAVTLTEDELIHYLCILHFNNPQWGFRKLGKALKPQLDDLGHSVRWVYDVFLPAQKIRTNHGLSESDWCEWCVRRRKAKAPVAKP